MLTGMGGLTLFSEATGEVTKYGGGRTPDLISVGRGRDM